jgi:uncharacterized membrane protein YeaQ/YmgE (transglycosylase-associated protein family)
MIMDAQTALFLVLVCAILGAAGQSIRIVIGLKKANDENQNDDLLNLMKGEEQLYLSQLKTLMKTSNPASPEGANAAADGGESANEIEREKLYKKLARTERIIAHHQWFNWNKLLMSLIIAFIVGAIAGIVSSQTMFDSSTIDLDWKFVLGVMGAGYVGTDIIEGLIPDISRVSKSDNKT